MIKPSIKAGAELSEAAGNTQEPAAETTTHCQQTTWSSSSPHLSVRLHVSVSFSFSTILFPLSLPLCITPPLVRGTKPLRCLSFFLSACLFSLFISQCVSAGGEGGKEENFKEVDV